MSIDFLKQHPMLKVGSSEFFDRLERDSRVMRLRRRQMVFQTDDMAERFFFISTGWIKLYRETIDGSEAVLDILNDGHIFGETSIFDGDAYNYSAESAAETTVTSLPIAAIKAEIDQNPKFAVAMLQSMARYRRQQDQDLEHRTLQNAPQRIGCFLLRLTNQLQTGPVTIHLPYDKTLVASRLGMKPETFSRALAKLKAEIDMQVRGSSIEISNIDALAQFSCNACSSEFPCAQSGAVEIGIR